MRKLRPELIRSPKVAENIKGAEELIQFLTNSTPNSLQPSISLKGAFKTTPEKSFERKWEEGLERSLADTTCDYCVCNVFLGS